MQTIFLIGSIIFALSSLRFLYLYRDKTFNSAFLVSFVTLVSYIVMYDGRFVALSPAGEPLYWTRWAMYALSCTLLAYTISTSLKFNKQRTAMTIYLTAIVMLTGALSSVYSGLLMLTMFVVSSVAYVLLIMPMLKETSTAAKYIKPYILLGWSVFPLFFILSPEGYGVISNEAAAIAFLVLDVGTKIAFYCLGKKKLAV